VILTVNGQRHTIATVFEDCQYKAECSVIDGGMATPIIPDEVIITDDYDPGMFTVFNN